MKASSPRRRGFTLIEILITVSILGILLAIAVPNWMNARTTSHARVCQKQLRTIESAKEQYLMSRNLPQTTTISMSDLVGDSLIQTGVVCPTGSAYTVGAGNVDPTCGSGLSDHVVP